ncbi:efflux transporter outer membrane subunit [Pseudoduganella sp. LjRoot289]|uniref:efflux transporter outer membrane subunit n=1 Tax=Pseudoduganella sp. LjRoot289 TaxID=3342314 RepID=UPI003ED067E8
MIEFPQARRLASASAVAAPAPRGVSGAACRLLASALALGALAGCASQRGRHDVVEVPLPVAFQQTLKQAAEQGGQPAGLPAAPAAGAQALEQALPQWWRLLGSVELNTLVERALAGNPELRIAALRVRQAEARAGQADADRFPVVAGTLQKRREAAAGDVGGGVPNSRTPARSVSQAALRADWRVDLWGERNAQFDSAQMQQWRATFQRDDVQRNLVSSVVGSYLDYLSFQERLLVATETDIAVSGMLAAVQGRLERGDATLIDLEQQRAAVYAVKATLPALEQQRDEALSNLTLLLGARPGELRLYGRGLAGLSYPGVAPGVPSALLLRRPDIRGAEARLLAADADLDVARTRLLPALDLSAQAGYGSQSFSRLFEPQTLFWNAIAGLAATIFDHGRREREIDYAQAMQQELVEGYARTIHGAVREVEDALGGIRLSRARLAAQREAAGAARRAWNYSRESYQAGAIDHLLLLDTERTYHRNIDEQHNLELQRYRHLVNLFSALGGGVAVGAPLPGQGKRPKAPAVDQDGTVQTTAPAPGPGAWQLELGGKTDAAAIAETWRTLQARFPDLMAERRVVARQRLEGEGGAVGLRALLGDFDSDTEAENACARLREQRFACRPVIDVAGAR